MSAPSDDTNHCSSRLKLRLVSAKVTPATARNSESMFSNRAMFCSTEIENGSMAYGVVHSAVTGFSGARRTSRCFTCADAWAISTARAAVDSTPARDRSSEAANPHRLGVGRAADFAVLGRKRAATLADYARVGVARPTHGGDVQSPVGDLLH